MKNVEEIKKNGKLIILDEDNDGFRGEIHLYKWTGTIVASWGGGWEHVSVSPYKRLITPSWDDMCTIKDMFWRDDEWVCQFHPPVSEYVSNVNNCLHLWKPIDKKMIVPPSVLVGLRKGQSVADAKRELKDLGLI